MKKRTFYLYILPALISVALTLDACRKYETEPLYAIKDELVWDEMDSLGIVANYFLNDLYTYLPDGFNRIGGDVFDAATDDAMSSRNNTIIQYFTNGRITALNNPDGLWSNSYYGIRRANIFLKNVYKVPNLQLNTYGKAEARFIRAVCYFELLKRYGGIPLVGDTLFTLEDNLQLPRNTFADCVDYIVRECDSIKGKLRVEPIPDGDWGRIPRGAAMALKARVLLYAASPLFNGGGVEADPAKRALTGYVTADNSRWQKALDAAQDLIALGYYGLNASFGPLFTTKKNVEVILSKQGGNNPIIEQYNAPVGSASPAISYGFTSPTQELVDAFPMKSGAAITAAGSGYDPANPYNNRDPRLAATVFYNNYRWLSDTVRMYDGGKDRPGGNTIQTKTGYYMRKFMYDFSNNTSYTNQSHNFILFRYAEILLNQAEALNELGRTPEAYTPLIAIRKRAGITAGSNALYGLTASMTQADMRAAIQNERRIELAFEEHRFWDTRRWKIADTRLNGTVHGMKITKNPTSGTLTYTVVDAAQLLFNPSKMYHMPLPYAEISKNASLIQNEGW